MDVVLEATWRVVTDEMNSELIRDFSRQEVEISLKQMTHLKAPDSDGMPPTFIDIIGVRLGMMFQKQFCPA